MRRTTLPGLVLPATLAAVLASGGAAAEPPVPFGLRALALPSGGVAGIGMDYIAFDPATGFVWVPAGNMGAVDVVDTSTGKVKTLTGFATAEVEGAGRKRTAGPSSVTVGAGVVYVGNRADSTVCAIDARSLGRGPCARLDSMPDGLAYASSRKEVWVTTPLDNSVRVLDATTLEQKARLAFPGRPEGFAVDERRGRFYTNLEDRDRTLAIDLKTREIVAAWKPACGEEGPHGLRVDEGTGFLLVACSARAEVLDGARGGAILSSIDTGDGVDDIDYVSATHLLYVAAAKDARLTIAKLDTNGRLTITAEVPTQLGARNGVVGRGGVVYLAHSGLVTLNDLVVVVPTR
jgi:DNA-binding beta-propeller fold protein YncE